MKRMLLQCSLAVLTLSGWAILRAAVADDPSTNASSGAGKATGEADQTEKIPRVTVDVARDRAKLLHDVYLSTLEVLHDRYFHGDRAMVPARAMEDIFKDLRRDSHTEARWLAVSLRPMSIDHEPKTEFEIRSAREIKSGKRFVEGIEDGFYRRTAAVSMEGGCVSCHEGMFRQGLSSKKFAGLVISIPVSEGSSLPEETQPEETASK